VAPRLDLEEVPEALGRYPGSKRWLPKLHPNLLRKPRRRGRFFDPFAGAGSIAIHYAKEGARVVMGDTNPRLVGVYQHLIRDAGAVVAALRSLVVEHDGAEDRGAAYRALRSHLNASDPSSLESAAAYLAVMNTCFNGVVRFNRGGACNVPYGKPKAGKDLVRPADLLAIGALLRARRAEVVCADFEETSGPARSGDVVYFDPPYVRPAATKRGEEAAKKRAAGFVAYSAGGFTLDHRKRLGVHLRELDRRGALWLLSDLSSKHALEVYGLWNVTEVSVVRSVSGKSAGRGRDVEVLVTNF
jgi:DNA adenine methylase